MAKKNVEPTLDELLAAWQTNEGMGDLYKDSQAELRGQILKALVRAGVDTHQACGWTATLCKSNKMAVVESAVRNLLTDREMDEFYPRCLDQSMLRKTVLSDEQFAARCRAKKAVAFEEVESLRMSPVKVA